MTNCVFPHVGRPSSGAPPGLGKLTAPLEAFVAFLRIDRDLLEVGAARSPDAPAAASAAEVERWVTGLPEREKSRLLVRLIEEGEAHLRAELLRRFRGCRAVSPRQGGQGRRTTRELLEVATQRAEERHRKEAERAARGRARREREAARARECHLARLAERETEAWGKVDALIATKQPGGYDEAVKLLGDLRELGVRKGGADEVEARLRRLGEEHRKKPSFTERLRRAGLAEAGP